MDPTQALTQLPTTAPTTNITNTGIPQSGVSGGSFGYNPSALAPLQQNANNAAIGAANFASNTPTLLQQLQRNLVSLFAQDNPLIQERAHAAQTYLNTPTQSAASMLPANMPLINGIPLNLSPTQQNAITTSRQNAALVPLAGLNNLITGMYGNIGDVVRGAGDVLGSQQKGFDTYAQLSRQNYQDALSQMQTGAELNARSAEIGNSSSNRILEMLKLGQPIRDTINSVDQGLGKVAEALQAVNKGGGGFAAADPLGIRTMGGVFGIGKFSPETINLKSKLAEVNEAFFKIAGTALTESEKKALSIPEATQDPALIRQRLSDMQTWMILQKGNALASPFAALQGGKSQSNGASSQGEWY